MKGFMAVFSKEVYVFLASPIFYVCAFIFLGLSGYFFYSNVAIFAVASFQTMQNPYLAQQLNLSNMVVSPTFGYMTIIMLILIPLMAMRLFSEEKRSGTIELLFTYPIRDMAVVLGKYLSTVFVFAVMVAGTLPFMLFLAHIGNPDWGVIGSSYLGIMLLAGAFISFGMFASSLTENQIISAVISFGGLLMFWVVGWATTFTEGWEKGVFDYISVMSHFDNLSNGLVDSRDVIYYLLFILFFPFCTLRYLDSKKWRA